jgi:5-methylcytosine-specific restriction enzyme A
MVDRQSKACAHTQLSLACEQNESSNNGAQSDLDPRRIDSRAELYLRNRDRLPDSDDAAIVELSRTLNLLFGEQAKDATLFRNPNGIYMKLANFRAVDPLHTSQGKRGLSRGGHGVAEIWNEFSARHEELKLIASAIHAAAADHAPTAASEEEEGAEAEEGRLLMRCIVSANAIANW